MNCKEIAVGFVQKSSKIRGMPKKPVVNLARLEALMGKNGWGLGELALYSGVKYDTVYSLAKGRRPNSNIATLKKIADALGVSVDYLLGVSDDASPPEGVLPSALRDLLRLAGELPATRQAELIRIAEVLMAFEREQSATSNEAAWEAVAAVLTRKFGAPLADDVLQTIAEVVPEFAQIVGPDAPKEDMVSQG